MIKNIEDKFYREELECIIDSDWGRVYLHTEAQARGIELLKTIFGIASISPVITTSADLDEITKTTLNYSSKLLNDNQTFALRTRRTGKHEFTSIDLARHVGKMILEHFKDKQFP